MFGPSKAGKTSLLEGLIREQGQEAGKAKSNGPDDKGPASNVAANEILMTRGHRQREGVYFVQQRIVSCQAEAVLL